MLVRCIGSFSTVKIFYHAAKALLIVSLCNEGKLKLINIFVDKLVALLVIAVLYPCLTIHQQPSLFDIGGFLQKQSQMVVIRDWSHGRSDISMYFHILFELGVH